MTVAQLKRELHALHVTHIPKRLCTHASLTKLYEDLRTSGIACVDIEPVNVPTLDESDEDDEDDDKEDDNDKMVMFP